MRRRGLRLQLASAIALALAGVPGGGSATACGLHRPVDLERGILNHVYPDSLHVLSAVRHAGLLPDWEEAQASKRDPFAFHGLAARLQDFGDSLSSDWAPGLAGFSMVLVDSMLWTRFVAGEGGIVSEVHSDGPGTGDLVVVTHGAVVDAIVEGRMNGEQAIALGLLRLYGEAPARRLLAATLGGVPLSGT